MDRVPALQTQTHPQTKLCDDGGGPAELLAVSLEEMCLIVPLSPAFLSHAARPDAEERRSYCPQMGVGRGVTCHAKDGPHLQLTRGSSVSALLRSHCCSSTAASSRTATTASGCSARPLPVAPSIQAALHLYPVCLSLTSCLCPCPWPPRSQPEKFSSTRIWQSQGQQV